MLRGLANRWFGWGQGADMSRGDAHEAGGGGDDPVNWVVVLTVFNIAQAALAAARLRDQGIEVRLRQEGASRALPVNVGILGRIDVMVPEEDAEQARDVLEDLAEAEDAPSEDDDPAANA
jgi:hypothetical protein